MLLVPWGASAKGTVLRNEELDKQINPQWGIQVANSASKWAFLKFAWYWVLMSNSLSSKCKGGPECDVQGQMCSMGRTGNGKQYSQWSPGFQELEFMLSCVSLILWSQQAFKVTIALRKAKEYIFHFTPVAIESSSSRPGNKFRGPQLSAWIMLPLVTLNRIPEPKKVGNGSLAPASWLEVGGVGAERPPLSYGHAGPSISVLKHRRGQNNRWNFIKQ